MARPKGRDERYQPAAESCRIQPLGGGRWVRIYKPDGKTTVVPRAEAADLIALCDADDRTPGWITRQMQQNPDQWLDVLEALEDLKEDEQ